GGVPPHHGPPEPGHVRPAGAKSASAPARRAARAVAPRRRLARLAIGWRSTALRRGRPALPWRRVALRWRPVPRCPAPVARLPGLSSGHRPSPRLTEHRPAPRPRLRESWGPAL